MRIGVLMTETCIIYKCAKRWWPLIGLLFWVTCDCLAQSSSHQVEIANRQLGLKAYGRAIELYGQLLSDLKSPLTVDQRIDAQANLAFSYKQVGKLDNAETIYRDLITTTSLTGDRIINYLHFAEILAANGKYRESQLMFEKYTTLKEQSPVRGATPIDADISPTGKKTPTRYILEVLALNTPNAEFSPMYYRDGLVYIAGKKGNTSVIETSGLSGGSGFLDMYYVPDRRQLKIRQIINADGSKTKPGNEGRINPKSVSSSSRQSANDSRTIGSYQTGINVSQGLGYNANLVNASEQFSRSINTRYHEGPVTFSSDGSRIVFTRNNYSGERVRQSSEGVTNLKLYTAEQRNGGWVNSQELPFNSNDYSVGHPTLSKDNRLLFFVSDMPGGFGGTDLYVSRYSDNRWSKPLNLGKEINTKGNELFPFADERGNLYFASDGRPGLGGLDIFYATIINDTEVKAIEHLEAPINSDRDDFGVVTDGSRQTGYFSTNRLGESDDILRFRRVSSLYECRNLSIRIYDGATNRPIDSVQIDVQPRAEGRSSQKLVTKSTGLSQLCLEVNNDFIFRAAKDGYVTSTVGFSTRALTDDAPTRLEIALVRPMVVIDTIQAELVEPSSTGSRRSLVRGTVTSELTHQPIQGVMVKLKKECDGTILDFVTGPDGRYEFELEEGCDYTLIAEKERYGTNTNRITRMSRLRPRVVSANLKMLRVGDIVQLDNIYYDLGQSMLRPDALRELDKLVIIMRRYPSLTVEIRSHTDSRGDAKRNKYVSTQRANAVVAYLASKGISRRRMIAAGYGESMLVNDCRDGIACTETEHRRNRRTEFKVLSIK